VTTVTTLNQCQEADSRQRPSQFFSPNGGTPLHAPVRQHRLTVFDWATKTAPFQDEPECRSRHAHVKYTWHCRTFSRSDLRRGHSKRTGHAVWTSCVHFNNTFLALKILTADVRIELGLQCIDFATRLPSVLSCVGSLLSAEPPFLACLGGCGGDDPSPLIRISWGGGGGRRGTLPLRYYLPCASPLLPLCPLP